nr:hypothetical chloroplast RF12 [Tetraselmis suecica]YP_010506685.1 hypothetical chloroplast RF12 [Tetraselmis suecica]UXF58535.1 hypothetical chloroplast RF12 [Tetraselmis suecica]UXF58548.1 hypothetical chloroplast RF12 [Tetraselmis suecica]
MNFEVFFQLGALFMILASGPIVIVLLSTKTDNGL